MGYHTHFNLKLEGAEKHQLLSLPSIFKEITEYTLEVSGIDSFSLYGKWYSWEEDLVKISNRLPGVTIILDGEGEDAGDIWRAWAKDGKTYREKAKISFPKFNPNKLK